jgi:hypothetical protein
MVAYVIFIKERTHNQGSIFTRWLPPLSRTHNQ